MKRFWTWDNLAPPGLPGRDQFWSLLAAEGAALAAAVLTFAVRLSGAVSQLYEYDTILQKSVLIPGAALPPYPGIVLGCLWPYPLLAAYLGILGAANWGSYYRGSRSIYLMRRLPDRWEALRRAVLLPLLGLGAVMVLLAVLWLACYWFYVMVPPEQCLDASVRAGLLSGLTGGILC